MKSAIKSIASLLTAAALLPAVADGSATVEGEILTLSGLVTNITAEAELGAGVTQVVMTDEGGVAFGASLTLAKTYQIDGTGVVSVAEDQKVRTSAGRLATKGHTLVKDGPGTLHFSSAVGAVAEKTRWIVRGGTINAGGGGFFGDHSSTTTNLTLDLREGTTFNTTQAADGNSHSPLGPLEMTGARLTWDFSTFNKATSREGNTAFKGGVVVHPSATPSYMYFPRYAHLNHCDPDCTFDIETGGRLIVDGILTNAVNLAWTGNLDSALTKRGGGELIFLKRNGWTGGTVFEGGTITVCHPEALGTSTLTIAGDVTIHVPVGVTFSCPTLATDGTHTLTITGGGVFTQPASVPEGLTIDDNTAGNASPLVGHTLHIVGGSQTVNVASDTIITSMVDDGRGAGKYTDIVKTGAGTLTLPTGLSGLYRNLTVKEGLVAVASESCFGWGETVVDGGGIRYTANITQTRTSRPVIYQGSGTIDVPSGLTWKFTTNSFACASAVVTKTGAGTWQSYDPLKNSFGKYSASRWIIHEGKLKCCSGDMFAGYTGSHNLVVEVHEDAIMELNSADHHLPVCAIVLRGGTLYGFYGQYTGSAQAISGGSRWKGWGLNGPITVLPSLNGKPSRIVARASHLHHGNDPQATTFDVRDGATLEIDAALEPGRANSNANPNEGGFVKTGGGTLRLLKPCGAKGQIDIREGTVELAEGARFNPAAKVNVCPNAKLVLGDKVQMANTVDLASALASTVHIEVPEGAEASYVANISGTTDGANLFGLAKTGTGMLRYGGAVAGGAILDVKEGGLKLKDGRLPPQVDVWIDASDASTITLDAESRVTNLVNKGAAGGSFVRNTRRAANVPYGPTVKDGSNGMNGHPVLAFDGNEALALCSYTNFTAPRSLYVYFVARRTKYVNQGGQGRWGGLFAFGSTTQSGEDQDQKGVCYLSQDSATALAVDHGVYSTASIVPPALEAPAIYYFFNTTNGYLFAVETSATSATAIPRKAATDEKCEPFRIDILQLGGRLMNFGQPQWFGDGNSSNRFGFFDFAEMIVTTTPLGEHQEAELLDYLRRKWLNKGSGSTTPPAWLTGIPATPETDADTALVMADGTSLAHEAATQTLGALVTEGTVDWTRAWDGVTAGSFPLFAVDGDVSLGTVNLAPEPLATRVKVMDWTGDLQNAAMWRLKGERIGALGVTLRDDGKAYWIISVGTAIHLR